MVGGKKIGILTLYRSFNHGAFWQAISLYEFIESQGYTPYFVDFYNFKDLAKLIKTAVRPRTRKFRELPFNIRKASFFATEISDYRSIDIGKISFCDGLVVGSDEVWNVLNPTFRSLPEYFGCNIGDMPVTFYAPSAGNSTLQDIEKSNRIKVASKTWKYVSARDINAQLIAERLVQRSVPRVLDPVFLNDAVLPSSKTENSNLIAIYSYNLPLKYRESVKVFAENHQCKLISIGFYSNWCDSNVNLRPSEFIQIFNKAQYIITDTFHGSVFSIKLGKRFATISQNKSKIIDLSRYFGIENRDISEQPENLAGVLSISGVSASEIALADKISDSKRFLTQSLAGMCC